MARNKNCTTIFMVPPFGIGGERLLYNGFIGAYLGDVDKPELHYEQGIYMLFKPEDITSFEDFLYEERQRGAKIVEDYDYEGGYVVVVYLLGKEYAQDYKKFLEGQYSKFSKEFKELFPETKVVSYGTKGQEREETTLQYRIFNKDVGIKEFWEEELDVDIGDSELWSSPDLDEKGKEYLNIGKIKSEDDV